MLVCDVESFFKEKDFPEQDFYYSYEGKYYSISLKYVIESVIRNKYETKSIYLLKELKATDDFIINVYLNDIADGFMWREIRNDLFDKIEDELFEGKEVSFKIKNADGNYKEYVGYQDEEGFYHLNKKGDEIGYRGWKRFSRVREKLAFIFEDAVIDFKRVDPSEIIE